MPKPSLSAATRCGRPLSIDHDSLDLTARRNVLLGLWAAEILRIVPSQREAYAWSVHFADYEAPGHEDVVAKLARDFAAAGLSVPERRIRFHLKEAELRATLQLSTKPKRHRRSGL